MQKLLGIVGHVFAFSKSNEFCKVPAQMFERFIRGQQKRLKVYISKLIDWEFSHTGYLDNDFESNDLILPL